MSKPFELNLSALQLKIFWKGFALRKCLSMRERKHFPTLIYISFYCHVIEPRYGSLAVSVWLCCFLFLVCKVGFVTAFVECINRDGCS